MNFAASGTVSPFAMWTTRVAIFSLGLAVSAAFLHRLFAMPTPVALNLFKLAFAGAAVAVVLAILALARVWRTGEGGAARIAAGFILGTALLAWPLSQLPIVLTLPAINDLTTSPEDPPPFSALAERRAPGANPTTYPGKAFAEAQAAAYPDIQPIEIDRSSAEVFGLAADTLRTKLFMNIVREQPPDPDTGQPGYVEAEERTLIFGFPDDVAIRVRGDENHARIDVRSASEYGAHDLGRNAERMRRVLKELVIRLEETVPTAATQEKVTLKSRAERAEIKKKRAERRKPRRKRRPKFYFPY